MRSLYELERVEIEAVRTFCNRVISAKKLRKCQISRLSSGGQRLGNCNLFRGAGEKGVSKLRCGEVPNLAGLCSGTERALGIVLVRRDDPDTVRGRVDLSWINFEYLKKRLPGQINRPKGREKTSKFLHFISSFTVRFRPRRNDLFRGP